AQPSGLPAAERQRAGAFTGPPTERRAGRPLPPGPRGGREKGAHQGVGRLSASGPFPKPTKVWGMASTYAAALVQRDRPRPFPEPVQDLRMTTPTHPSTSLRTGLDPWHRPENPS